MKLPIIPDTHSMLCLTQNEEEDMIEIHCDGQKVIIATRKARNGRASLVLIAPRDYRIQRVKVDDKRNRAK